VFVVVTSFYMIFAMLSYFYFLGVALHMIIHPPPLSGEAMRAGWQTGRAAKRILQRVRFYGG
jgi:hypothetical protein